MNVIHWCRNGHTSGYPTVRGICHRCGETCTSLKIENLPSPWEVDVTLERDGVSDTTTIVYHLEMEDNERFVLGNALVDVRFKGMTLQVDGKPFMFAELLTIKV